MVRRLLIMRHAKSSWDAEAESDFARPLAKRGREDAPRMGRWLAQQGLRPDWLASSPALRARETTLAICTVLGLDPEGVLWTPEIYEAGLSELLALLGRCPAQSRTAMLVGHNPGLERLLRHLSGDRIPPEAAAKPMPTAAIAVLRMPEDWRGLGHGAAEIETLVRPRTLKGA